MLTHCEKDSGRGVRGHTVARSRLNESVSLYAGPQRLAPIFMWASGLESTHWQWGNRNIKKGDGGLEEG